MAPTSEDGSAKSLVDENQVYQQSLEEVKSLLLETEFEAKQLIRPEVTSKMKEELRDGLSLESPQELVEQIIELVDESIAPESSEDAIESPDVVDATFETTPGKADMAPLWFEVKMLALVYLRAIQTGQSFYLGSNVQAAGKFDDVVLMAREEGAWKTSLLQLKHKLGIKQKVKRKGEKNRARMEQDVKSGPSSEQDVKSGPSSEQDVKSGPSSEQDVKNGTSSEQDSTSVDHQELWTHIGENKELEDDKKHAAGYASFLNLSPRSVFGVVKYWDSYCRFVDDYSKDPQDWPVPVDFQKLSFILYTNAVADMEMHSEAESFTESDKMFFSHSKGQAFKFNDGSKCWNWINNVISNKLILEDMEEKTKNMNPVEFKAHIIEWLEQVECRETNKELTSMISAFKNKTQKGTLVSLTKDMALVSDQVSFKMFISNFFFYTHQGGESDLTNLLRDEMKKVFHVKDDTDIEELINELIGSMEKWWSSTAKTNKWLIEVSQIWSSVWLLRMKQISAKKLSETCNREIQFLKDSIHSIYTEIKGANALRIEVNEDSHIMTSSKVYQALKYYNKDEKYVFICLTHFLKLREEIFVVLQSELCEGIVIECEDSLEKYEADDLATALKETLHTRQYFKIILVTSGDDKFSKSIEDQVENFKIFTDKFSWKDLTSSCQKVLESRQVIFQGHKVLMGVLIGDLVGGQENVEGLLQFINQVQGKTMRQLLKERLSIGKELDEMSSSLVRRRLTEKTSLAAENGTPLTLSRSDVSGYSSKSITVLPHPSDRVVLVVAEPGMGKTTLTIQEAHQMKTSAASTWVVRIDMARCNDYLENLNGNEINESTAIAFFTKFAVNESNSVFEKALLQRFLTTSGNMSVFLDGVDEVCPDYEDKVCSLLQQFLNTRITNLWVTSRHAVKDKLEHVLSVPSRGLARFSLDDQIEFFLKYWNATCKDEELLRGFVDCVIRLTETSLPDILSIPLHVEMLAEHMQEDLKAYIESSGGNMPEKICPFGLLRSFFMKKISLYASQKKQYVLNNPAVKIDNKTLEQSFWEVHERAAIIQLLSLEKNEPSSLLDNENPESYIQKRVNFLSKAGILFHDGGKLFFVHEAFAEFLAVLWIYEDEASRCQYLGQMKERISWLSSLFSDCKETVSIVQLTKQILRHFRNLLGDSET